MNNNSSANRFVLFWGFPDRSDQDMANSLAGRVKGDTEDRDRASTPDQIPSRGEYHGRP